MNYTLNWLPSIVNCDGDWSDTMEELYKIFRRDIITSSMSISGCRITWNTRLTADAYGREYEDTFWHLVTRDNREIKERQPDWRRAERLPWCAAIIKNFSHPDITTWDYEEGNGAIRKYIWAKPCDYIVILERRNTSKGCEYKIVTAFYIEYESKRRELMAKYRQRMV